MGLCLSVQYSIRSWFRLLSLYIQRGGPSTWSNSPSPEKHLLLGPRKGSIISMLCLTVQRAAALRSHLRFHLPASISLKAYPCYCV